MNALPERHFSHNVVGPKPGPKSFRGVVALARVKGRYVAPKRPDRIRKGTRRPDGTTR
jgi:hypothetical protein